MPFVNDHLVNRTPTFMVHHFTGFSMTTTNLSVH